MRLLGIFAWSVVEDAMHRKDLLHNPGPDHVADILDPASSQRPTGRAGGPDARCGAGTHDDNGFYTGDYNGSDDNSTGYREKDDL